ncbi:uncharacterized protein LY89DRAFT_779964 [Mollisia scopiformis]|uniref:Uncharacterized protein n=1 Tax=Mollisia scopiformis TaxID=149040 RepID=A0A194XIX4_MOLSC|nr:uncharacterized protein LY89DRAFT_779964 [Mollisia scopiformis]KUJ20113.1 hypothetical protein LY89DRAFT_779964 [Mollisia scopiformis]
MAELGAVAAITQLAGQTLMCANALYSLFRQIKAAPRQIEHLLQEISIIAQILKDVPSKDVTGSSVGGLGSGSAKTGLRGKLKLGSVMMVMKEKEVRELVERLRGSYNSLPFAVVCHSFFAVSQKQDVLESCFESGEVVSSSLASTVTSKNNERSLTTKTERRIQSTWWGLGYILTSSIKATSSKDPDHVDSEVVQIEHKVIPATWTRLKGFALCQGLDNGNWKYWFKPGHVVPESSEVFQACMYGDLEQLIALVKENRASVHDTTETGYTPLHVNYAFKIGLKKVAAFHHRPNICEWLIRNGANGDEVDVERGPTPLYLAAFEAGRGNRFDPKSLIYSSDSVFRPRDTLETLRILVESGQCDPMAKTLPADYYSEQTALHGCVGPIEAFTYLLGQDKFYIDLEERDGHDLCIERAILVGSSYPDISEMVMHLRKLNKRQGNVINDTSVINHSLHLAAWNIGSLKFKRNCLARFEEYWLQREQGYNKASRWVLADILRENPPLHSGHGFARTPLARLVGSSFAMHGSYREPFCKTILTWFDLLREAGHDLQEYIRTEATIYQDYIYNSIEQEKWHYELGYQSAPPLSRGLERTIKLDTHPETGDLLFSIIENLITAEEFEVEGRIPGAWHWDQERIHWYMLPKSMELRPVTFSIGLLKDGTQKFGVLDEAIAVEIN